jgi:hypothetical protein
MQVRLVPNQLRPGVGREPARENRRAFLPQHARLIPVIEEASKLGYLVYPPLHDTESLQIHAQQNDVLAVTLWTADERGGRERAFVAEITRSAGAGGIDHVEITIVDDSRGFDEPAAREMLAALTVGVNAPPGTIGLRGTHNFITPEGWDSVYTAVLNDLQRPAVGVISMRVETDWLPHETEFRYALEGGDVLSIVGSGPIGQVFFVPREEAFLAEASKAEEERFFHVQRVHRVETAKQARVTKYGGGYTYQDAKPGGAPHGEEAGANDRLLQDADPGPD